MEKEQIVERLEKQLSQEWANNPGNIFRKLSTRNFQTAFSYHMCLPFPKDRLFIEGVNFCDSSNNSQGRFGLENDKANNTICWLTFKELMALE